MIRKFDPLSGLCMFCCSDNQACQKITTVSYSRHLWFFLVISRYWLDVVSLMITHLLYVMEKLGSLCILRDHSPGSGQILDCRPTLTGLGGFWVWVSWSPHGSWRPATAPSVSRELLFSYFILQVSSLLCNLFICFSYCYMSLIHFIYFSS